MTAAKPVRAPRATAVDVKLAMPPGCRCASGLKISCPELGWRPDRTIDDVEEQAAHSQQIETVVRGKLQ
jgi:hypothetical protein